MRQERLRVGTMRRKSCVSVVVRGRAIAYLPCSTTGSTGRGAGAGDERGGRPEREGRPGHLRRLRRRRGWPKPLSSLPGPRELDVGRGAVRVRREPEPRVRAAARRAAGRSSGRSRRSGSRRSDRASSSRCSACRSATRRPRALPERSSPRTARRPATISTPACPASTTAGSTSSSSSTRRATSSRTGRSGTRCSAGRTRSTSAPTIRRRTSGSSTTTATRSSSSRNDGKKLLQTIGEPNVPGADDNALLPPDVHGVAARRHVLRRRRLRRTRAS